MELFKTEIKKINPCKINLKVEVKKDLVEKLKEEVYIELQKNVEISGFRKGSVPLEIIKKRYSETIKDKTLNKVINKTLFEILKNKNINYIPETLKIDQINFKEESDIKYEVSLEIEPEFKVKNYKGLKLKKEIKEVTQKDIDKVIEYIRENNAKIVPLQKQTITQQDIEPNSKIFCVINYKIISEDEKLKKLEGKNVLISLSQNNLPKGFKEGLIGLNKKEKKIIQVTFPDNYNDLELMGKQIDLEVELLEIKEKQLPDLNEEFIKNLGYKSFDEFIEIIKNSIKEEFEKESREKLKNQIYEILIKEHDFMLPEFEFKKHYEEIVESIKKDFVSKGNKEEDFKLSEEQIKNLKKKTEDELKLKYILKNIIKQEKIEISNEMIEKEKNKIIALNPSKEKEIKEYFEKNIEIVASKLLEEKIFEIIISNAKIKEIKVKQDN